MSHFDVADQAFVQSHLDEDVFLRLPKVCGELSDKVVWTQQTFVRVESSLAYHIMLT